MQIRQISIFLENRPGQLSAICRELAETGINIATLSLADTSDFGIVRMITTSAQTDEAICILREAGYTARTNHVICAAIDDRPMGLCRLLTMIEKEGLSVEYMYSFRRDGNGHALMILRLSENDRGAELLQREQVRIYTQEEVDLL